MDTVVDYEILSTKNLSVIPKDYFYFTKNLAMKQTCHTALVLSDTKRIFIIFDGFDHNIILVTIN